MTVVIDKTGSHLHAGGFDDLGGFACNDRSDFCDFTVFDGDIAHKCRASGTIYDLSVFDQNIKH